MKTYKLLGSAVLGLTLLGGGCLGSSDVVVGDRAIDQLITFGEFDDNQISTAMPVEEAATSMFAAETLFSQAEECGYARDLSYYIDLMTSLEGVQAQIYTFDAVPTDDYQGPTGWTVVAMPNVLGYPSMDSFRTDFNICAVGGNLYPLDFNANTLIFASSCGSGYADDTGRPNGCLTVREQVEPTIVIK